MKKLSIKARVTLWYTGLLVLLLALGVLYLLSFSAQMSTRQLSDVLQDVTADAVKGASFSRSELDDDDIDFYRDGVSVFLYDTSGRLIAPKVNRGIQVDSLLEDQVVKTVDSAGERWLVYDIYAERDGTAFWVRGLASLSGAQSTLRGMLFLAFVGVPAFALIAGLGGWIITRHAFAPVAQMACAADAITSGSNLSLRLPEDSSGDELAQLSRTINAMLKRLEVSFEHERQFTSDVSHELRTPISVILAQSEYALSENVTDEERIVALASILRQGNRMSAMVSQLLLLARAENGRYQPDWSEVNLCSLCETIALELAPAVESAGLKLRTELPHAVIITADETLLIRLVTNLLSNAISYSEPGGNILLSVSSGDGVATLVVQDQGIGIEAEALEKIWDRFYRADSSRSGGSTGLGLAMVKWIAELHGGSATVQSEIGVGSEFTVTLRDNPTERN